MARPRHVIRTVGLLGAAALVAAGCGGGGEVPAGDPGVGTPSPTPAPTDGTGAVTGDSNGDGIADTGVDNDGDGIPDPAPTAELGATATIPDLSGGDIGGGGLGSINASPMFEAGAVEDLADEDDAKDDEEIEVPDTTTEKPVEDFAGARIYVDGVIHEVGIQDSFPSDNPVFRLVDVTSSQIEIELIAGEFTVGGGSGTLLDKGELVSLLNSSEQLTYRIKYLRPLSGDSEIVL